MDVQQFMNAAGLTAPRAAYWWPHVEQATLAYGIVDPKDLAAFLAQASHESVRFTKVVENLNYTSTRLREVFKVFRDGTADADDYAMQPERLANFVYANRLGNGDEASGDGWRFRGRGLFQITGRRNYERMGEMLLLPLTDNPELLELPEWAAMSAAAYWKDNGCNGRDFDETTRRIAGPAMLGQVDRMMAYERAVAYLT